MSVSKEIGGLWSSMLGLESRLVLGAISRERIDSQQATMERLRRSRPPSQALTTTEPSWPSADVFVRVHFALQQGQIGQG